MDERKAVPIGIRIGVLAGRHPESPAVISVARDGTEQVLTWSMLERRSNVAARLLARQGVDGRSLVALLLPAGLNHVIATVAVWKLGGVVLSLDPDATDTEIAALLETARPAFVVSDSATDAFQGVHVIRPDQLRSEAASADPLPDQGIPRSAHATGGSTGRPRIILRDSAWMYGREVTASARELSTGVRVGQTQLVMLPLHHGGFTKLYNGLALDHKIVLMERFAPKLAAELIVRHRVAYFVTVPVWMRRLLAVPGFDAMDLSSVTTVHQSAAGCPDDLKLAWFKAFPPETLHEGYGGQERIGTVWIRGDEWLRHRGSVGRPDGCRVRIYLDDGELAAAGETGEIFLKTRGAGQPTYFGPGPRLPERDGYLSLGDAGFLDDDGYLHVVGRRAEMINVGGVKVYPAEVEHVLLGHEGVADAAVVHRDHAYLGQAVHAVVVPVQENRPPTPLDLSDHCRGRLSAAKVPVSYEFVSQLGYSDAGKLRRQALSPDVRRT